MYEVLAFKLAEGASMRVLRPVGKRSFVELMAANPKTRARASLITRAALRIARNGIDWAFASDTFKWVSPDLSICELRVKGKVIRVMTYLSDRRIPVYLFDFDGHQGKSAAIPPFLVDRAQKLAKEAERCLRAQGGQDGAW